MVCKRVSKRNSKEARQRGRKIIREVRKVLKKKYKFVDKLVGSASRNTIIKDSNDRYDLDYQLILTNNSKKSLKKSTVIKKEFLTAFNKKSKDNEIVEDSTTAITLRVKNNNKEVYSIDFVIIKELDEPNQIIRRNGQNEYTWNPLRDYNPAFDKFNLMTPKQKQDLCDNHVIPRKCKEKQKHENEQISSTEIFIQEINQYDKGE